MVWENGYAFLCCDSTNILSKILFVSLDKFCSICDYWQFFIKRLLHKTFKWRIPGIPRRCYVDPLLKLFLFSAELHAKDLKASVRKRMCSQRLGLACTSITYPGSSHTDPWKFCHPHVVLCKAPWIYSWNLQSLFLTSQPCFLTIH